MWTQSTTRLLAFIAVTGLVTGCDTGTGSGEAAPFDVGAVLSDYETVEALLSTEGLAGFRALSGRTPFSTPAATSSSARAPIISDLHRGVTFVYDPELDEYVVDPARTGAPPTGVTFIVYELDEAGRPLVDQEIGYADLVDEGDGSFEDIILHVTVIERGITVLDYRTALDDTGSGGTLTVGGFLVGDGVRLDFGIDAVGFEEGGRSAFDLTFELGVEARGFHVAGHVHGAERGSKGEGDIEITAHHRDESFRVDLTDNDGRIDGSVELNAQPFATISGSPDDPKFYGSTGEPLTGLEFLVLWRVIDSVEDVFDLLEDLLDPVDELVLLGAVL